MEIRRTSYGIPHIKAANEAGIGYGVGYAYAQDNFCLLAEEIITVNGMRSKFFGPDVDNGSDSLKGTRKTTNLNSDFFFRLLNETATIDAVWASQSAEVKALMSGYVAGVNRYLTDTGPNNLPAECRAKPWVRPLRSDDIVKLMRRYTVLIGSIDFIDDIVTAQPPVATADMGSLPAMSVKSRDLLDGVTELGSNAVALGREMTENGRGLLLGQPHFPWEGILRFYQIHITIPGKLDVMGASLPGLPVVSIGFTANFAWSHTVNTSAHYTLYALQLDEKDPTRYRVGGKWHDMIRRTASIEVLKDGRTETLSREYWSSIHGPLIERPGEYDWDKTTAFALRDANADNGRMIEAWYSMNRAQSLTEFEQSVKRVLGMPWINTIAADKEGNALYMNVSVVPNVPEHKKHACVDAAYEELWAAGIFVLDGADPSCAWEIDPQAPQEGIFSGSSLPVLRRSDFVQNSNDSSWMTNPAVPLTGFPSIVSMEDVRQNERTRLGLAQIYERRAGSDGFPGNKFSLHLLQNSALNNKVYLAALNRRQLQEFCEDPSPVSVEGDFVDIASACGTLTDWDGTADTDSIGFPIFNEWWERLLEIPGIWSVPFSVGEPIDTPRVIKTEDPAIAREARIALARAVRELQESGVDWQKPWGELHFLERGRERIGLPGGATSAGLYNAMVSVPDGRGHYVVRFGTSYIQTVGFTDEGPEAEAILAYSQSSDPLSPHSADQTRMFAVKKWIKQPFSAEEIESDPAYSVISMSE